MTDEQKNEEHLALAQADEKQAMLEATIAYLQNRVVTLNVEVRVRDAENQRLQNELDALRQVEVPPKVAERRRENPDDLGADTDM